MTIEIRVPPLGESLTSATIAKWYKKTGEYVQAGDIVLELETDKVSFEIPAPVAGRIEALLDEGVDVAVDQLIARLDETKAPLSQLAEKQAPVSKEVSPSVERPAETKEKEAVPHKTDIKSSGSFQETTSQEGERRVPLSRLRQTIARNLKEAQNTAAILTTFNEVDMGNVRELRSQYRDIFEKKNSGTRLGFMSFFAKAVIGAIKDYPALNAQIDGNEIVYRDHVNLGIAVGTERGLVVPVIRHADGMNFAELERHVADYGKRARDGALKLDELAGGTFTITNGGIFGSLLSTPILNRPQSGVLGMHTIQDRPVARNGQVVIRPMMYVALSYDHRLIDGKEAVSFLVRIKELIEDPRRLLLEV
ncbi:dihydrolipoyllysine-residue succinyltransferase [Aristophania vespae]|uniref:Dihydrolipoyllysine-residue succinyltransferase n=1 Tax=Aristophania vespae TaxID=2697033 RepID=A0A6P1NKU6_9PROT|nr:dihydrolipoyllysine-residue succinyltransferase [Aristophania vespae]QHI96262.1 dihydrolipoyllysine-residue succinyltransferase [Aristophania vespae]